ncbi:hypothetical protein [Kitasatospora camelliae]|uniref:Uncharacterized protein n=1 Tax=Kitasatospora camelliae TaxID=3156397 RepID=A0AAU8JSP0_9ACTN
MALDDTRIGVIAGSVVHAASVPTGRRLLGSRDAFVAQQSPFDRRARLDLRAGTGSATEATAVTEEQYLEHAASQVLTWEDAETAALRTVVAEIDHLLAGWSFFLPETLHLVKTTGREEGRTAHTRHLHTVVLPAGELAGALRPPTGGDPPQARRTTVALRDLLVRALFHLISKNNPNLREELYALVGYARTGRAVALPDVPWPEADSPATMADLRITHPDAPELDVYVTLKVTDRHGDGGGPGAEQERALLPVLLADRPYDGGSLVDYRAWHFLAIEQTADGWAAASDGHGRPLTYPMSRRSGLWWQYLDRIGRNATTGLHHPEEILAENFLLSALVPTPTLLSEIDAVLTLDGPA